jgi:hypothetical protein
LSQYAEALQDSNDDPAIPNRADPPKQTPVIPNRPDFFLSFRTGPNAR